MSGAAPGLPRDCKAVLGAATSYGGLHRAIQNRTGAAATTAPERPEPLCGRGGGRWGPSAAPRAVQGGASRSVPSRAAPRRPAPRRPAPPSALRPARPGPRGLSGRGRRRRSESLRSALGRGVFGAPGARRTLRFRSVPLGSSRLGRRPPDLCGCERREQKGMKRLLATGLLLALLPAPTRGEGPARLRQEVCRRRGAER